MDLHEFIEVVAWNSGKALVGIVGLITIFFLAISIYNLFFHPLRKFPGPLLNRASTFPYLTSTLRGHAAVLIHDLHRTYGPVVRITPNELVFCNGSAARDILNRQGKGSAGQYMTKSPLYYNVPVGGVHSIISVPSEADHARYRRLLAHAFSERALREQEPLIKTYLDLLMLRLGELAEAATPFDISNWFNGTTFDIIGDLTFGESFNCLQSGQLHPWITFLFGNFKASMMITSAKRFPGLAWLLMRLMPQKRLVQRQVHYQFTRAKVLRRLEAGNDRSDFMTYVLRHNDKNTGMTTEEIISTFSILLIAGSETTATWLSVATYYLLRHPPIMERLVREVRTAFTRDEDISMLKVGGTQLHYLNSVLEEALRIQTPVPLGSPRVVPAGGEIIDGRWVPGGTTVFVGIHSANHQPHNWARPLEFLPERWLTDSEGHRAPEFVADDHSSFIPFSLGTRNCIGKNLAYAEARLVLTRIIWNFDLELADESRTWAAGMKMYNLWDKPPLMVKLRRVQRETI